MCAFRCLLKRHVFSIAIIVKISLNENENLFVLAMHKWWKSLSIYQHRHDVRGQLILLSICLMEISSIKHGSLHLFACFKHRKDVLSPPPSLSLSLSLSSNYLCPWLSEYIHISGKLFRTAIVPLQWIDPPSPPNPSQTTLVLYYYILLWDRVNREIPCLCVQIS